MGRPLNKRFMGSGSGNQIRVTAKLPAQDEAQGFLVSQRGTTKFKVNINGTEGICTLVNKNAGSLSDNEMIIDVINDASATVQVTKIFNRTAITEGNVKSKWNFDVNLSDTAVQALDAVIATLTINTQPLPDTSASGVAQFIVAASIDPSGTVLFQWEEDTGSGFVALTDTTVGNVTYVGSNLATLDLTGVTAAEDTWDYRCVVSAVETAPVTSTEVNLAFGT